jgi:hypothetical protein
VLRILIAKKEKTTNGGSVTAQSRALPENGVEAMVLREKLGHFGRDVPLGPCAAGITGVIVIAQRGFLSILASIVRNVGEL